jgi:hypothetical protein
MKILTRLLVLVLFTSFLADTSFAQRRRRGSIRYARPDGTYSRSTRRGGNIQSTQTTQENRRTTQTTATGRRGESVTSTSEVTREGDTIKMERQSQASTGASREVSKEVEIDEGRVEKVERESSATGRYGETVEREREVEREGYGVASFEGKAETSTGREAEVEGAAARGAYGRRGVVADVDTKYRGDWTVAAGRGPYGAAVTRLPQGYRPYTYYGRSYYHYGYAYYRPYTYGGVPYYFVVPPPYGVVYTTVPAGAMILTMGAVTYYYADHVCYKKTSSQGSAGYEVVPPPEGIETGELPPERATVTVGDTTYYYYKNTFYREILRQGELQYAVVNKPQGVVIVNALPAEFEIVQTPAGGSYFAYQNKYYLPYLEPNGNELYIVVDPPSTSAPQLQVASSEGVELAERSLTVPTGTSIPVRLASELSSATSQVGQRFTAYLDDDIKVGEILAAPRGTKVHGMVAAVEQASSMSGQSKLTLRVTDIEVNGRVIPVSASPYAVQGAPESKDTAKKIGGAAAIGAMIGAIADGGSGAAIGAAVGAGAGTAASAATAGKPATLPAQTPVKFTLQQPLTVPIMVKVASTTADGEWESGSRNYSQKRIYSPIGADRICFCP